MSQGGAAGWYNGVTIGGHNIPEASSAMQKSVRRSRPEDAVYWAMDLYLSGYQNYVWKRLKIMVSEDVGLANPGLPAQVHALHQMWVEQTKQKSDNEAQAQLFLVHAVLLTATSPKSRMVDNMRLILVEEHKERSRPVPPEAIDKHTPRGKRLGKGIEEFITEGSIVKEEGCPYTAAMEAHYKAEAESMMLRKWSKEALAAKARGDTPPSLPQPGTSAPKSQRDMFTVDEDEFLTF